MSTSLVFILLFFLPFVILPFGVTQFETPKVILAEVGILVLFFVHLFSSNSFTFMRNRYVFFLYLPLVVLMVIDMIFLRTNISFFGNAFRMQGIFLLWLLMLFSLLVSAISLKTVSYWWYVAILFVEVICMFFLPINESGRWVGTLGEPNALAAFAVFTWPFIFFGIKKFGKKEIATLAISLLLVGVILYFSQSHSALIAVIIEIVFILLQRRKFSLGKTMIICFCLNGASYLLPFFQNVPYENRTEIWKAAVVAGATHPFLGSGFGNTEFALHTAAVKLGLPIEYYYIDSSHNIFLDFWVQGGLFGIGILLTLIGVTMRLFLKQKNIRNCVLLLGMLTVLSFNPASVVELLGLWWLLGQGLILYKSKES